MTYQLPGDVESLVDLTGHELTRHDLGVHEMWWEANARYPTLPLSSRLAVAEHVIRSLLQVPGVHLVAESDPGRLPAAPVALPAAGLREWSSWVIDPGHPVVVLRGRSDRIDLDASLRAAALAVALWQHEIAHRHADAIAAATNLMTDVDPTHEQWIRLTGAAGFAMIAVHIPLVLGTSTVTAASIDVDDRVLTVTVDGDDARTLHARPDLLRATVLPQGWDRRLDPEAFSANDLFRGADAERTP